MTDSTVAVSSPWYRTLNSEQWKVLLASNLGWLFDGFEIYALFVTVGFALHQLLDPSQYAAIPKYAGYVLATTVFGWATGGVIGGIVADYIGRKRTMMLAILAYSLTTGLSAFAWDWQSFAILRFLVGVGIGSEWATGASIVSELWPDHARGKGGGLLQCGAGLGGIVASGLWIVIGTAGPGAWRYMYLIGVLPALVCLWIWKNIPESPRWEQSNERRRAARALRASGGALDNETAALNRFTVTDLFAEKTVRRALIASFLMMLSVTFAFWGVATFIPTYVGGVAAKLGGSAPEFAGYASMITNICGTLGFVALGFLADAIGRKPTVMLWYAACLLLTPVVYLWGAGFARASRVRRHIWLLHARHLGVGAGLAAGVVSDPDARHRDRLHLQRAALCVVYRAADRRLTDRRVRRVRAGGDDRWAVLSARCRSSAVPSRNQRQAVARHGLTGEGPYDLRAGCGNTGDRGHIDRM